MIYDTLTGVFATSINGGIWCYDYGGPFSFTYLDSISCMLGPDTTNSNLTFVVSGGLPAINGSNFLISDLLPVTISIDNTNVSNNESFTLSNLGDGEIYSFKITDDAGSSKTISNTYLGNEKPSYEQIQPSPNPFDDFISIHGIPKGAQVYLLDINGGILNIDYQSSYLETESLLAGLYFIIVDYENRKYAHKVIKY